MGPEGCRGGDGRGKGSRAADALIPPPPPQVMDVTVESDRKMSDATWRAGATAVVRVTLADGEPQRTK